MAGSTVLVANPWLRLPQSAPFVLEQDAAAVERFNSRADARTRIDTSLLPEPFLGRHDAPVVVLCLNPGWKPTDAAFHANPIFAERSRANLKQAETPYPFFLLDPAVKAPGSGWWWRKLRWLIEEAGLETVANRVLCIEYFPYHSHRYGSRVPLLPSQEFSFHLLRAAIEREALIVVMRSARRWEAAVPELATYGRRISLRNVQNVCVSPGNCPDGYDELLRAIVDGR